VWIETGGGWRGGNFNDVVPLWSLRALLSFCEILARTCESCFVRSVTFHEECSCETGVISDSQRPLCHYHYMKSNKYWIRVLWVRSLFLPLLPGMKISSFLRRRIFHPWPVWLYHICSHCLINGSIIGTKVVEYTECVLIFSTASAWSISDSEKNPARYKWT
jgi:hypothetical protein